MVYGYKNIWKIASPILVGMVIQQLIGVTDVVFLGRVGQTELGASAIAGLYYITVYMLGVGFGIGVQILIARLNGSGHYKQIAPLFYQALGLMSGFAVAAVAVSYLLTPSVLPLLISSERVLAAAQQYLGFRVWGFVFSFAVIVFRAFYVGTVNTRVLTWSAVVMLAINVVGNYLLIFGKFGFPQMGIGGAALASVIAEAVSALFFVPVFGLTSGVTGWIVSAAITRVWSGRFFRFRFGRPFSCLFRLPPGFSFLWPLNIWENLNWLLPTCCARFRPCCIWWWALSAPPLRH